VGGFYRVPTGRELRPLRDRLEYGRDLAIEAVAWVARFAFPDQVMPYEFVSTDHPDEYPILGERVVSDKGLDIPVADFLLHVEEYQVPHSTSLHARLLERGEYLVGPLARYSMYADRLTPAAAASVKAAGLGPTCHNPFQSVIVRAVEVVHAFETAIEVIDDYVQPDRPAVDVEPRAGVGHGVTEAPRGLLYHRYEIDDEGKIADAVIVPPTAQNQPTIEHDLFHFVEHHLDLDDDELRRRSEVTIRNHDPCISCSTHFLDMTITRS